MMYQPRGFTLLIAIILVSVLLSVGFALLDIAYKQAVLASTARQSQFAFYAADSAMECALYWDQRENEFGFNSDPDTITCANTVIPVTTDVQGNIRTSEFSVPCAGGGSSGVVTIYKSSSGPACGGTATSCLYAQGYNTCDEDNPNRIERGLKVFY